jgi:hypothetical protein
MDEIFGELENFSGINIAFDVVVRLDDSNESFRLVSVNGFRYPGQFKAALNLILEKTEKETWSVIGKLPAEDIRQFLSELILRYARLKNLVREPSSCLNAQDLTAEPRPEFYLFDQRIVKNDVESGSTIAWPTSVLIQASEFAKVWYDAMNEAVEQLKALMRLIQKLETKPLKVEKIPLKVSVSRLAFYLGIHHEKGYFGDMPKTVLCRSLSAFFSTLCRENVSWQSLKNQMDSPGSSSGIYLPEINQRVM